MQGSELAIDPIRPIIDPASPHAPRPVHFDAKAKQVLMIFCSGAVSHLDTFDYKPEFGDGMENPCLDPMDSSPFKGNKETSTEALGISDRAGSGKMTSDLLPHIGSLADDLCFIHSLTSETNTHGPGENFMCTGFTLDGPALGPGPLTRLVAKQTLFPLTWPFRTHEALHNRA